MARLIDFIAWRMKRMFRVGLLLATLKIFFKRFRSSRKYRGNFKTWIHAQRQCRGYDADNIVRKVYDSSLRVKLGQAAYERDSVTFQELEYSWPILSALMLSAVQNDGELKVLDFGGALGSTYFQHKNFFWGLRKVLWSIVEQEKFVAKGKKAFETKSLKFYSTIEECLREMTPNIVLFASVLQYLPDFEGTLVKIFESGASIVLIDRTPFSELEKDLIVIQHVPHHIYDAEYPMRIFSQNKFKKNIDKEWRILCEVPCKEDKRFTDDNIPFTFMGFILIKNAN